MSSNIDKDKWINEALDSTKGMVRAAPGADLFENITQKLANRPPVKTIQLPVKQWAAAAIILLALNIGSVVYMVSAPKKTAGTNSINPLAAAMQAETTYNY